MGCVSLDLVVEFGVGVGSSDPAVPGAANPLGGLKRIIVVVNVMATLCSHFVYEYWRINGYFPKDHL